MPDATTFAELFGGVFPTEAQVEEAVVYGPLGGDLTGTAIHADAAQLQILDTLALLGIEGTWLVERTFETASGDKVAGVRTLLVGVANKTSVSGSNGITRIKTDDGTYTLRIVTPVAYEDIADSVVTVGGADDVATVVLTPVSLPIPENPGNSILEVLCLDETVSPEAGVLIEAQIVRVPSGSMGTIFDRKILTATSGSDGIATLECAKGATYRVRRGPDGVWQEVKISRTDTTTIESFIGKEL
jgi:hypothetical protein